MDLERYSEPSILFAYKYISPLRAKNEKPWSGPTLFGKRVTAFDDDFLAAEIQSTHSPQHVFL